MNSKRVTYAVFYYGVKVQLRAWCKLFFFPHFPLHRVYTHIRPLYDFAVASLAFASHRIASECTGTYTTTGRTNDIRSFELFQQRFNLACAAAAAAAVRARKLPAADFKLRMF